MIRLFLYFCAFLVVGSGLFYLMEQDNGYLLIVWGKTSIDMSIWFALLVLVTLAFVYWLCRFILRRSWRGIRTTTQKVMGYSRNKAQQQATTGLVHFIEGDWSRAHKQLTRSAKKISAPIINYLAAARCAYEMGDEQAALQLLHQAENSTENSDFVVALTQARMQLANQHYEQALATLERAAKVKPNHTLVLTLQQQVYTALKDWGSLKELLPKLHRQHIGSVEQRSVVENTLYRELLAETITNIATLPEKEKYQHLMNYWGSIPNDFQQDKALVISYTRALMGLKKYDEAEEILRKGLNRQWHDQWVELYGLLQTTQPEASLKVAETWLQKQTGNASVLLTLGRLCLQNKQWGRAKDFFKTSIEIQPAPETYAELARLQHYLGEEKNSHDSCRQGLLSSVKSLTAVVEFEKELGQNRLT